MDEARWGLMEMRQVMCESSHIMFDEMQHTQDSSSPPPPTQIQSCEVQMSSKPSNSWKACRESPWEERSDPKESSCLYFLQPPSVHQGHQGCWASLH